MESGKVKNNILELEGVKVKNLRRETVVARYSVVEGRKVQMPVHSPLCSYTPSDGAHPVLYNPQYTIVLTNGQVLEVLHSVNN